MKSQDERLSEHAAGFRAQLRLMLWVLGPMTLLSGALIPWLGIVAGLMFAGCVAAWLVFGVYSLVYGVGGSKAADAIGKVLMPSGSSTPSVAQHSDIETMAIRGQYEKAAAAYQAAIAANPADIVACEKLGQMAMRDMKDYKLAVFAYKEAERRAASEKSKLAYGVIVAELYRDKLGEPKRAVVELSRLIATYPDQPNVPALREELDLIKSHLFDEAP